jgi:hypothetical protein
MDRLPRTKLTYVTMAICTFNHTDTTPIISFTQEFDPVTGI